MKDCVDLTIGFLCDLAEVLSGHHSATKSAAQPETAMSPMGPPLRVRLAGEEEPDHGIAALAGPVTPALAVVLHGHEATAADPETGLSSRARHRPGRPALRPSRPGAGKPASLGWRSRHLRPIADQGHPCAGQGSRPGI